MQSTPSTYTYRDPRHVGVISNGTSCCFGVWGFDRPWLTFKWEEANGSQHEDCQPFCSPPSRQTLDCYLLFLDPQITSPAPVQWAGQLAALAILSLTGWLENKHFRKGQFEYLFAFTHNLMGNHLLSRELPIPAGHNRHWSAVTQHCRWTVMGFFLDAR